MNIVAGPLSFVKRARVPRRPSHRRGHGVPGVVETVREPPRGCGEIAADR
jgi:hypothetical protein